MEKGLSNKKNNIEIGIPDPVYFKGEYYCPFCGKKMTFTEKRIGWFDKVVEYFCDCEDFKNTIESINKINEIAVSIPYKKFGIKTNVEFCKL